MSKISADKFVKVPKPLRSDLWQSNDSVGSLPSGQWHIELHCSVHSTVPGQAVKQFTSTRCLHFRKELLATPVHAMWMTAHHDQTMTCTAK